ncbi:hypothetical protein [Paenibacillus oleatilyticus]|uniref:DUF3850 domain-containing protein n=1 Tax=Paenibacillus oleatilyticus TaxID=2594886 RepID=A0ABV4UVE7_9BACL
MKFIKLETAEQLKSLKKGDIVLVEWKEIAREYRPNRPITHHSIHGVNMLGEVILNAGNNSYFDIEWYLQGKSTAKEVWLVSHEKRAASPEIDLHSKEATRAFGY